ncbi:MAG TPA: YcdB/YcdC domain-containing protein [Methanoregula sp.]|nr:YcdB/YcdC domain-containing protein [Methanoregula sp.]
MDRDKREDSGAAYIPERYRQQFAARQRRKNLAKLLVVLVALVCVVSAVLLAAGSGLFPVPLRQVTPGISGVNSVTPAMTSASAVNGTTVTGGAAGSPAATPATAALGEPAALSATASATSGASASTAAPSGAVLTPAFLGVVPEPHAIGSRQALAFIGEDYPQTAYDLLSGDISSLSGKKFYAFSLRPARNLSAPPFTAYLDFTTGDPYTPGQESAPVTASDARNSISDSFPGLHPNQVRIRYSPSTGTPVWNFTLFQQSVPLLAGSLDAKTGQIIAFSRNTSDTGRPDSASIDITAAQKIADNFVSSRNGPVAVNMSNGRYVPGGTSGAVVAGQYLFTYDRMVDGYPCDAEGFTVAVDSVSGDVTSYERRWGIPEFSFEPSPVPVVLQRDATFTVLHKAGDLYPGLVNGITVISTEIKWDDHVPAGTIPAPSAVRLAWKVTFDDELIRAMPTPVPAVAWVDVQSGNLISIDYQH